MESDTIRAEIAPDSHTTFQHSIEAFAAIAEAAYYSLQNWEKSLEAKLTSIEHCVDAQLHHIQTTMQHFEETLQATNVQEWRETAEAIYKDGRAQTQLLQETYNDIKKNMQQISANYERAATQVTKNLTQTLQGLRVTELQQLADDSCEEVKTFASSAKQQIAQVTDWFNWKNLSIAFLLALLVAVLVSLYIDDEWPWEAHKTVVKQRIAGQMLITAWPQLNRHIQQQIMDDFA